MARITVVNAKVKPKAEIVQRTKPRYQGAKMQEALSASEVLSIRDVGGSPLDFALVRQELEAVLRSTGGRPGLPEAERRKIPVAPPVWDLLSQMASRMSEANFKPTAAHVASTILTMAVRALPAADDSEIKTSLRASARVGASHPAHSD